MELTSTALACGLIASAILFVVLIVLQRQGRRGPILLSLAGLVVLTAGLSASAAVLLVGLTRRTDTADLALGLQFGSTAIALALVTIALVRHRRLTSVR